MSKDQEFKAFTIWGITAIASFRKSMKLSFIKLYSKAITVQRAHNKDRI